MKIQLLKEHDEGLSRLVDGYSYKKWRNYASIRSRQPDYYRAYLDNAFKSNAKVFITKDGRSYAAACLVMPMELESSVFGIKMAKLDIFYDKNRPDALAEFASGITALCKKSGIKHLSVYADTSDRALWQALTKAGFFINTAQLTFMIPGRSAAKLKNFKLPHKVVPYDACFKKDILGLSRRAFRNTGRFYNDPYLDSRSSDALYYKWAENCLKKKWADFTHVVTDKSNRFCGFGAWQVDRLLRESTGIRRMGFGIGAVSESSKGAFASLFLWATKNYSSLTDIGDFTVNIDNIESMRIHQRAGYRLARSEYVLSRML